MSAKTLDGKAIARRVACEVSSAVAVRVQSGRAAPGLAIVLVGDNPASLVYIRHKREMIRAVGMQSFAHDVPASTSQADLLRLIDKLNHDPTVHGILVQRPLPSHIDADIVAECIDRRKDVDGLHPYNMGRLTLKRPLLRPCAPAGCMRLLRETGQALVGKRAVIVGDSVLVGRPMALELLVARCTVTVCEPAVPDLATIAVSGHILVVAVDRPRFIQGEWVKPDAIVIDAGISRSEQGKLCGDVDFVAASLRAAWITPVPGGVGPMTVAMLAENTLRAAQLQDN